MGGWRSFSAPDGCALGNPVLLLTISKKALGVVIRIIKNDIFLQLLDAPPYPIIAQVSSRRRANCAKTQDHRCYPRPSDF